MYITLPQKAFSEALTTVQTLAGTGKTLMPILKNVILIADAHGITLKASNEETSIQYHVSADVQASGTALLPAHLLAGFVHDLPAAPVTLVLPSPTDATAAQVRCQSIKANIKHSLIPLDEFPQVPVLGTGCQELLKVDCELLREVIEQVAFASSEDSSRPVLGGIRVAFAEGQASFAAADAFRLAVRRIAIPDHQLTTEAIIPAQTLRNLARLLPASGSVVMALTPDRHQVLFHTREMDLSSRLIEGAFPDFRSLLALQPSTNVMLSTTALIEAVRLSSRFAKENKHQLRLRIRNEHPGEAASLLLEAEAPDLGANEIGLTKEVTVSGPDLTLQINDRYLADALAVAPTPQVMLEFIEGNRPIALRPVGALDLVSIIMPLIFPTPPSAPLPTPRTASVASVAGSQ